MDGCIEWQGTRTPKGYGKRKRGRRTFYAHRWAYAESVGIDVEDLPSDVLVRHTCDNPPCVNPDHLEPGTHADNHRDAAERGRRPALVTACVRGHAYDPENTYIDKRGRRHCRWCGRVRGRQRHVGSYRRRLPPFNQEMAGT